MSTPQTAKTPAGVRRVMEYRHVVPAAPAEVFPLLCPVREYEWIDGWTCELIFSRSGVAELDCVFSTEYMGAPMLWTCSHYEPPRRIQYVATLPGGVMRLEITLEAEGEGTAVQWKRVFTGLNAAAAGELEHWNADREKYLGEQLRYFLATGRMLMNQRTPA